MGKTSGLMLPLDAMIRLNNAKEKCAGGFNHPEECAGYAVLQCSHGQEVREVLVHADD